MAPPKVLKDKHLKLKLRTSAMPLEARPDALPAPSSELTTAAILATPRCHPDSSTIRRSEKAAAVAERDAADQLRTENGEPRTAFASRERRARLKITFDVLAWNMAELLRQSPLLAGDTIDIAFTIGHNDHPEYGGLELELRDFRARPK